MEKTNVSILAVEKLLLDFIAAEQTAAGGFASLSSTDPRFSACIRYMTNFAPALIGWCLAESVQANGAWQEIITPIREGISGYLLGSRSEKWSWNYWAENSAFPCPDDLDDTFSCLLALITNNNNPAFDRGTVFGAIVASLTATETAPGGPYRTWLTATTPAETRWRDIDVAVNATIAYFLSFNSIRIFALQDFLVSAIKENRITSPYYASEKIVLYLIARAAGSSAADSELREISIAKLETYTIASFMDAACIALAWLFLGKPEKAGDAVKYLIEHIAECQKPFPFWIDPAIKGVVYYAGCGAITAAHCFLALEKYRQWLASKESSEPEAHQALTGPTEEKVRGWLKQWKPPLPALEEMAEKLLTSKYPPHFISWQVWQDMQPVHQEKIPFAAVIELGTANFFGWLGYGIFDDIIDEQRSIECLLPAVESSRTAYRLFAGAAPTAAWRSKCLSVFRKMELAGNWEQFYCHKKSLRDEMPDFSDNTIANKSLGHMLGPLLLAAKAGFSPASKTARQLETFFRHYLIARQLNDDAHDWSDDLALGIINPVTAMVLCQLSQRTGDESLSELREIFWKNTVLETSKAIADHARAARQALGCLEQEGFLAQPKHMLALIEPLEKAAAQAVNERTDILAFLKQYQGRNL